MFTSNDANTSKQHETHINYTRQQLKAMNAKHQALSRIRWLDPRRRLLRQGTNLPYLKHDSSNSFFYLP